jgi:hypothetical protein
MSGAVRPSGVRCAAGHVPAPRSGRARKAPRAADPALWRFLARRSRRGLEGDARVRVPAQRAVGRQPVAGRSGGGPPVDRGSAGGASVDRRSRGGSVGRQVGGAPVGRRSSGGASADRRVGGGGSADRRVGRAFVGRRFRGGPAVDGRVPGPRPHRRTTAAGGRRPLRLTRRGRLVVLALMLLLCGLVAAAVAVPGRAADPATEPATAVVQPGDTLWSFTARHAPSDDPFATIDEVRWLNDLEGSVIHPGQRLVLPRRR